MWIQLCMDNLMYLSVHVCFLKVVFHSYVSLRLTLINTSRHFLLLLLVSVCQADFLVACRAYTNCICGGKTNDNLQCSQRT
jgi:hypothetical protein